jgi:ABC-type lipopolysaccharide export system ATPase subunit
MNDAVPIRITGLTKTFAGGAGITDVDLVVQAGQVFGFLGPNGAGTSTTIRCLLGLYRADGVLVGACGLNQACHGEHEQPLYLEQYLEQPVEAAIETRLGVRPARHRIIEVGNLACSEPGHARLMFAALCRLLCDTNRIKH